MSSKQNAIRLAVVGSGPAAVFTCAELLRGSPRIELDLLERLPEPFGLARYGIAPDHPHTRKVLRKFQSLLEQPSVQLRTGVDVGAGLPLEVLRRDYRAVLLATGAERPRRLAVEGAGHPLVQAALYFSQWVNGHPRAAAPAADPSRVRRVVVIGHGNVALDAARLLLKDPATFADTDMAPDARAWFRGLAVDEVVLVGRRGPVQASFREPELREILALPGVRAEVDPGDADRAAVAADRSGRRRAVVDLLRQADPRPAAKRLRFVFRHPVARFEATPDRIRVQCTSPSRSPAEWTADLVLPAIGQTAEPLAGVPFDEERGCIPTRAGRVCLGTVPVPGLYAAGWAGGETQGLIGHHKPGARITAGALLEDLDLLGGAGA